MVGLAVVVSWGGLACVAEAQTGELFRDNFTYSTGATLNTSKWTGYDSRFPVGRTRFGLRYGEPARPEDLPVMQPAGGGSADGYARFMLSPFHQDYNAPGVSPLWFRGTEIYSNTTFQIPTTSESFIEFNAIMRGSYVPSGVVCGFYPYSFSQKDEIDIELLGRYGGGSEWFNTWNGPGNPVPQDPELYHSSAYPNNPINWKSQFTLHRMCWIYESPTSRRVEWYVANSTDPLTPVLRRTRRTPSPIPDATDMQLHLNIWVPHNNEPAYASYPGYFPDAYDGNLQPSATLTSTRYYFDVDSVWVNRRDNGATLMGASESLIDIEEEPASGPSKVQLSQALAAASQQVVWLTFDGQLDTNFAANLIRYTAKVNGKEVVVQGATYDESTNTVILNLPDNNFLTGDTLEIGWNDLRDSEGYTLSGTTTIKAD